MPEVNTYVGRKVGLRINETGGNTVSLQATALTEMVSQELHLSSCHPVVCVGKDKDGSKPINEMDWGNLWEWYSGDPAALGPRGAQVKKNPEEKGKQTARIRVTNVLMFLSQFLFLPLESMY